MNALELADWIENGAPFGKYETAKQAVVMLRQQQAEIEALKAEKIRAYDNGYEDGRKPDTHPVKEPTYDDIRAWLVEWAKNYWDNDEFEDENGDEFRAAYSMVSTILRKAQGNERTSPKCNQII